MCFALEGLRLGLRFVRLLVPGMSWDGGRRPSMQRTPTSRLFLENIAYYVTRIATVAYKIATLIGPDGFKCGMFDVGLWIKG